MCLVFEILVSMKKKIIVGKLLFKYKVKIKINAKCMRIVTSTRDMRFSSGLIRVLQ